MSPQLGPPPAMGPRQGQLG